MNLYLFDDNDSASVYGIGTYIKALTEALKNTFVRVRIVHLRSVRPEFEIEKINRVEHWYIPEVRNENTFSGNVSKVEGYFRDVVQILRLHIKNTNDLVFHFNFNHYQAFAKELKASFNCKTVTTVHFMKWMLGLDNNRVRFQTIQAKPHHTLSNYEKSLIKTDEYESLLYKEVDKVIVLCRHTQMQLQTDYGIRPDKIVYVPNGLTDNRSKATIQTREKWRMTDDELLFLFAGRLQVGKGLPYLLKAFRKVLKTQTNCRLVIAGSGDYDTWLKACEDIWKHVTWAGMLPKEKLYALYAVADIGVMPSLHEQCSYVAIEMMMHGLPIIAGASTGLQEMVEDRVTGLHVPIIAYPDRMEIDTDRFAEKMLFLLQNHAERKQMGLHARERYERLYTSDVMRENMVNFYTAL